MYLIQRATAAAKAPRGPAATRRTASVAKVPAKRAGMRETASSAARACSRGPGLEGVGFSGGPGDVRCGAAAPSLSRRAVELELELESPFPASAGVDPGASRGERAEMWFLRWLLERVAVGLLCAFRPRATTIASFVFFFFFFFQPR